GGRPDELGVAALHRRAGPTVHVVWAPRVEFLPSRLDRFETRAVVNQTVIKAISMKYGTLHKPEAPAKEGQTPSLALQACVACQTERYTSLKASEGSANSFAG